MNKGFLYFFLIKKKQPPTNHHHKQAPQQQVPAPQAWVTLQIWRKLLPPFGTKYKSKCLALKTSGSLAQTAIPK